MNIFIEMSKINGHAHRLLNTLPPTRLSAVALEAFLRVAGYRLHAQYGRQFAKLLQHVVHVFLPGLAASNAPDCSAVTAQLNTYIERQRFRQAPEGRNISQQDYSSYDRA